MSTQKGGHRGRKFGRNKLKCQAYKLRGTREKNKLRKMLKVFKKQPNNKQLAKRIESLV